MPRYTRNLVVIANGSDLLLESWEREGNNIKGHVVNGGWELEIKDGKGYCNGKWVKDIVSLSVIEVPNYIRGSYNNILKWAENQLKGRTSEAPRQKRPTHELECPECGAEAVCASGGGVKCTKCPWWFCY